MGWSGKAGCRDTWDVQSLEIGIYTPNGKLYIGRCSLVGFRFIHSFRKPLKEGFGQGSCAGSGGNMPPGGSESQESSPSPWKEEMKPVAPK